MNPGKSIRLAVLTLLAIALWALYVKAGMGAQTEAMLERLKARRVPVGPGLVAREHLLVRRRRVVIERDQRVAVQRRVVHQVAQQARQQGGIPRDHQRLHRRVERDLEQWQAVIAWLDAPGAGSSASGAAA